MAIQTLCGIAKRGKSEPARVQAATVLIERGWGKAPQVHSGEDGGDIRITIRQIIAGQPEPPKEEDPK